MNLSDLFSGQADMWLLVAIGLAVVAGILFVLAIVMVIRMGLLDRRNRRR